MDIFKVKPTLSPEDRILLAAQLSQIVGHQEEGKECYLVRGRTAVRITPDMNPESEIANAISGGLFRADGLSVSTTRPTAGLTFSGCTFSGCIDGAELKRAVNGIDIEAPDVFEQAESVVRRFLREENLYINRLEHDFFVYCDLIDRLPLDLDEKIVQRLVYPLVHRLECSNVASSATEYLEKRGLSAQEIEAIRVQPFSPERLELWLEAKCRENAHHFIQRIGIAPATIRKLTELKENVDGCRAAGCGWISYTDYLKSLSLDCPRTVIDEIVMPLTRDGMIHVKREAIRTLYRLGHIEGGDAVSSHPNLFQFSVWDQRSSKAEDVPLEEQLEKSIEEGGAIIRTLKRAETTQHEIENVLVPIAREIKFPTLSSDSQEKLKSWALDYLV